MVKNKESLFIDGTFWVVLKKILKKEGKLFLSKKCIFKDGN